MNFFKVRQKNTGLFFIGGAGTSFSNNGERYHTATPCTAALNRIELQRPRELEYLGPREPHERDGEGKWWDERRAVIDNLHPDNLEVVEYREVEVRVVPRKA